MFYDEEELFEADGEAIHDTEDALKVRLETGHVVWVPKKWVHDNSEVWKKGQTGKFVISMEHAKQKKLV